jgi:NAD(P)-dependent dehydrogenase (short-subunit alcohol dehydrogenase family)
MTSVPLEPAKGGVNSGPGLVLVTGGSRGIGTGIATVFVGNGAQVVICGRDRSAGEAAAATIDASGPGACQFVQCDVAESSENERLVSNALDILGGLDCLVNNAGWHPPHRSVDDIPVQEFVSLLRLNVVSYFEIAKLALPALRRSKGSIINIGSLVGTFGQEHASDYVATKAAIEGLTKALAIDEARYGVRVNVVLPGVIETPSHAAYLSRQPDPEAAANDVNRWQWLGRTGSPEDVGRVCLFLASEGARFVTGASVRVSGGAELGYGQKAGWLAPAGSATTHQGRDAHDNKGAVPT